MSILNIEDGEIFVKTDLSDCQIAMKEGGGLIVQIIFAPETRPAALQKTETPEQPRLAKKPALDVAKCKALRTAGWSVAKISDEMGVSTGTIYKALKETSEEAADEEDH